MTMTRVKYINMRKVIISEYVTLDGVMEDPGGAVLKDSNTAVGAFNSGMTNWRSLSTMYSMSVNDLCAAFTRHDSSSLPPYPLDTHYN